MVTLKDLEKLMQSKEMKESLKINRKVYLELKREYNMISPKNLKKIVSLIPEYNPQNFEDAVSIGRTLCAKFVITGKFGGRL